MRAAGLTLAIAAAGTPALAYAATSSATMSVSVTVVDRCTAVARSDVQLRGAVVGCDKGAPFAVVVRKPEPGRGPNALTPVGTSSGPGAAGREDARYAAAPDGLVEYVY